MLLPLAAIIAVAIYTQRCMRSVAAYMAGERLAGRYLLGVARGELQAGAVVFVALFEVHRHSGFTTLWWSWANWPVGLIIAMLGFVYYRFRETRAMTLAQFFELRYGRSFRVFTGVLAFVAGILNFGIIPAVGARLMVHLLGLPVYLQIGGFSLPTNVALMALLLTLSVLITLSGGVITVMVTNCLEGIFAQATFVILMIVLAQQFEWRQIVETLTAAPPGQSLLNPMDSGGLKDFNVWFILMSTFFGVYGTMALQNSSSYNAAARTPHEAKMGILLARMPEIAKYAVISVLAVCALTWMTHPDFAGRAGALAASLQQIDNPQVRQQMEVPVAIAEFLPVGILGLFCAAMVMGIFGGDSTHLHSWSSIFVQDVLVPLRQQPFSPSQHVRVLRWAVVGVAAFAFVFGSLFKQTEYVVMWFQLTTGIYVGGAGAAIIGGLYWRKGTAAGAWAAVISGMVLSAAGILLRQFYGAAFPLNGIEIYFWTAIIATSLYVLVSLATNRGDFDLEAMLHRKEKASDAREPKSSFWARLLGIDAEHTRGDRWVVGGIFTFTMGMAVIALGGTLWCWVSPWPIERWSTFWRIFGLGVPLIVATITTLWFSWGGFRDLKDFFRQIRAKPVNHADDGRVLGHRNAGE